jgi:hypothetical protein
MINKPCQSPPCDYVGKRGWTIVVEVKDIGSGASISIRQKREELSGLFGMPSFVPQPLRPAHA